MIRRFSAHFTLAIGLLLPMSAAASISGVVTLLGEPPTPDQPIQMGGDRRCSHDGEITTERWKLSNDGGLAEVVVYLSDGPVGQDPPQPMVDQVRCVFVPHVTAVRAGQPIEVRNSDPTFHNVRGNQYMGPGSIGRDLFNFGQPTKGMTRNIRFDEPGIYRIICDVHPWMRAWVVVVDTTWFAVTDSAGRFELPSDLEPGEYVVKAWHHQFEEPLETAVTVDGEPVEVAFEFDAADALQE